MAIFALFLADQSSQLNVNSRRTLDNIKQMSHQDQNNKFIFINVLRCLFANNIPNVEQQMKQQKIIEFRNK